MSVMVLVPGPFKRQATPTSGKPCPLPAILDLSVTVPLWENACLPAFPSLCLFSRLLFFSLFPYSLFLSPPPLSSK